MRCGLVVLSLLLPKKMLKPLKKVIQAAPQITVEKIQDILGIESTAINLILYKYLDVCKPHTAWFPHTLTGCNDAVSCYLNSMADGLN